MFRAKRIKLSGAQYRKRRKAKEFEIRMQTMLSNDDSSDSTVGDDTLDNMDDSEFLSNNDTDSKEFELSLVDCQNNTNKKEMGYPLDPGLWGEYINFKVREYLVRIGPVHVKDIIYPSDENGRRFTHLHYTRQLTNGEELERKWLVYSQHKNLIYCFCCKLFTRENESKQWPTEGFSNWRHTSRALLMHEKARSHMVAFQKWKELEGFIKHQSALNVENQRFVKEEKEHCHNVIERFISAIHFLTSRGMLLKGNSDVLYERHNGNFLKMIELLAKFDPHINEHVRRVTTNSCLWKVNYMSDLIQKELIAIMADQTKKLITKSIKQAKYYSVIVSCSTDKVGNVYCSLVVRYVARDKETQDFYPQEHFICFLSLPDDGLDVGDVLLNELNKMKLCVNDIRCQSFDQMSLARSKKSLIQTKITQMNQRAFVLSSVNHSLVSAVGDAVGSSMVVYRLFYGIRELFEFFSNAERRWNVLKRSVPSLSAKFIKTKNWPHQMKEIQFLRDQLPQIYDLMYEMRDDIHMYCLDGYECSNIIAQLNSFNFICGLIIWHEILSKINPISTLLQSADPNFEVVITMINDAVLHFEQYKQLGFGEVLREAETIAALMDVEVLFSQDVITKRCKANNTETETTVIDFKEHFVTNFFEFAIDTTIKVIEERRLQIKNHTDIFKVFYRIYDLQFVEADTLKEYCDNADKALREADFSDIDGSDLCTELKNLFGFLTHDMSTLEIMNFVSKNDLETVFPNIQILLRILFTFPLTLGDKNQFVCKSDDIHKYLHSPIIEEHTSDLSILSIESEMARDVSLRGTIEAFTSVRSASVNV